MEHTLKPKLFKIETVPRSRREKLNNFRSSTEDRKGNHTTNGLSNPQMISSGLTRQDSYEITEPGRNYLGNIATAQRSWLLKHKKPVDFNLAELKKLRGYFEQLDEDGSGSIGLEELE